MGVQLSSTAWVRSAADDPQLVQLRLLDDSVGRRSPICTAGSSGCGPTAPPPSARPCFLRAAERFRGAGFGVADTLASCRADLDDPAVRRSVAVPARPGTSSLRRHEFGAAATVSTGTPSGPGGGTTPVSWRRSAMPRRIPRRAGRFRRNGLRPRTVLAFAVAGASTEHGYLQRLSVDPAEQGAGHGRTLTLDSLRWMTRDSSRTAWSTRRSTTSGPRALHPVGFRRLPEYLEVLELDVRAAR